MGFYKWKKLFLNVFKELFDAMLRLYKKVGKKINLFRNYTKLIFFNLRGEVLFKGECVKSGS